MMPAWFIAHGSPLLAMENNAYTHALSDLGNHLRPKSIVIFSAHWENPVQQIGATVHNTTIYDFGGFPPELYQLTYPAPGNPELAETIQCLFQDSGIVSELDHRRGLDHGAWVILRQLFPEADIPVVALSVNAGLPPAEQYRIGSALTELRSRDVLIIGSGVTVHNFSELGPDNESGAPWAAEFDQWVWERIARWDMNDLFDYAQLAPHARRAVPPRAREHFIPLFYALGSCHDQPAGQELHRSYRYGTLSHVIWQFGSG